MKCIVFCVAMTLGSSCFASSVCIVTNVDTQDSQPSYIEITCSDTITKKIMSAPGAVPDSDQVATLAKLVDQGYQIVSQNRLGTKYTLVKK